MNFTSLNTSLTDGVIESTLCRLSEVSFPVDPLFSVSKSFEMSLRTSAIKRHGAVIEAAIIDALQESKNCEVSKKEAGFCAREIDVFCVDHAAKAILAFDVKRGNSYHDSGKKREMRRAAEETHNELLAMFPGYRIKVGFLHYYSDTSNHVEKVTFAQLKKFTGIDVRPSVDAATLRFSRGVDSIISRRAQNG